MWEYASFFWRCWGKAAEEKHPPHHVVLFLSISINCLKNMCFLTSVGHGYRIACPHGITLSNIFCHVEKPLLLLLISGIKQSYLNRVRGVIDAISLTLTFLFVLLLCFQPQGQRATPRLRSEREWARCHNATTLRRRLRPSRRRLPLRRRPAAEPNSGAANAAIAAKPSWSWCSKNWAPVAAVGWS